MDSTKFQFKNSGNGGSLIYTLDEGESVDRFEHLMIFNNSLKGYLGYVYEKMGDSIVLTYSVARGTSLAFLKKTAMTKSAVLKILIGIVDIALLAEEYMLNEKHLALDYNCIFVDISSYDVYIPYVPTNKFEGKNLAAFLKEYAIDSVSSDTDSNYLVELLRVANNKPNASAAEFKKVLNSIEKQPQNYIQAVQPQNYAQAAQPQNFKQAAQPQPISQSARPQQPVKNIPPQPEVLPEQKKPSRGLFGSKNKSADKQPQNIPAPIVAPPVNNEPKKSKWGKKKEKHAEAPSAFSGMSFPGQSMQPVTPQTPSAPTPAPAPARAPAPAPVNTPAPVQKNPGVNQPLQYTQAPSTPQINVEDMESMRTVLISTASSRGGQAYIVSAGGDRIPISKQNFTIGKDPNAAIHNDYVINNNPSVSRNHAVITKENGQYYVTDMSSLNGTYVNDNKVFNTPFPINSGDILIFANEKYTFRLE